MISVHQCTKNCCSIELKNFEQRPVLMYTKTYKAGAFIFDPVTQRVLLVRSKNDVWGCPKGTIDNGETALECAIREVHEETGLDISRKKFEKITYLSKATYFYMELPYCEVHIQTHEDEEKNDAVGITWINIDCLCEMLEKGAIVLSNQCNYLFKKFLNRTFIQKKFSPVRKR